MTEQTHQPVASPTITDTRLPLLIVRGVCAVLLFAGSLAAVSPIWLYFNPAPSVTNASPGGTADLELIIDRTMLAPGDCTQVWWQAEGIQTIEYRNRTNRFRSYQPTIGQYSIEVCPETDILFELRIRMPDGERYDYSDEITISTPSLTPVYLANSLFLLLGAVFMVRPRPLVQFARARLLKDGRSEPPPGKRAGYARVILPVAALVLVVLALYLPAAYTVYISDFRAHVKVATTMNDLNNLGRPNFLYHVIIIFMEKLLPGDRKEGLHTASFIVFVATNVVTAMLTYAFLLYVWRSTRMTVAAAGAALVTLLLMPIVLFTLPQLDLYSFYLTTANLFHNPTTILLKPFAVILLWGVYRMMFEPETVRHWQTFLLAMATVASLLIKPNLMMIVAPPVGLYFLYMFVREREIRWNLFFGILLPSALVLLVQFFLFYTPSGEAIVLENIEAKRIVTSRVEFGFFRVWLARTDGNVWLLAYTFLVAVAFPAALFLSNVRRWSRDKLLVLVWAMFGVGLIFTYFFSESGQRGLAGNFIWSGRLGLYMLMLVSTAYLVLWVRDVIAGREKVTAGFVFTVTFFQLHLVSGVLFQLINVFSGNHIPWR